jgi:acyl carrier protein
VSQLPSREALLAVPQDGRLAHLTDALQRSLASWLAASPDAVDPDQPLIDLGFDSLMAIEVRNEIEGRLHVLVPVPAFFSDASVRTVAAEVMLLVESVVDGAPAARAILRVPRTKQGEDLEAELLAELDSLSDQEVSAAMEQVR